MSPETQRECSNIQKASVECYREWSITLRLLAAFLLSVAGILTATTLGSGSVLAALVCNAKVAGPHRAIALVHGSAFCDITISVHPCRTYQLCESWSDCTSPPQAAPQPGIYNSTDALVAAGAQSDRAAEVQVAVVFAAALFTSFVIPLLSSLRVKRVARVACALASAAVSFKLLEDSRLLESAASSWAASGEAKTLQNCSYPVGSG
jgi:hypothetical protein